MNPIVLVLSCIQVFVTPWTVAHQAPLSMGLSRQEYWSDAAAGVCSGQGVLGCDAVEGVEL